MTLIKRHESGGITSQAVYSPCQAYRYLLTRHWGPGPQVLWIMLNPSTATEAKNDPTIERCQRRAVALGCGGLQIANLFAFRATQPEDLKRATDPVGPLNDAVLAEAARGKARLVICGWGNDGAFRDRGLHVAAMLADAGAKLHHLGLTRIGEPRHPLYVSYSQKPMLWLRGDADQAANS